MTGHADSPREALERLSTLLGSEMNVSPRDAVRMIVSSVDLLVQIQIMDEIRLATSIARLEKNLQDGEPVFTVNWQPRSLDAKRSARPRQNPGSPTPDTCPPARILRSHAWQRVA